MYVFYLQFYLQFVTVYAPETGVSPSSGYVCGKGGTWEWHVVWDKKPSIMSMNEPECLQNSIDF